MEFNSYEYTVEQKSEGKWKLAKIFMLSFYLIYTAIYFLIIYITRIIPLGALIPVTLWIIVFSTWRFTKPAYKYEIQSGTFIYTVIWGGRTRRERFNVRVHDARLIAPVAEVLAMARNEKIAKIFDASPSKSDTDIYGMMFEMNSKLYILKFKATKDALKILKYYNSSTKITEVSV